MPRGHDYFWTPKLLVLEGASNLALAVAGLMLAMAFLHRRGGPGVPSDRGVLSGRTWTVLATGAALAAVTHLLDVWVIWAPLYWLDAVVRCVAALVALAAATALLKDSGARGDR